VYIVPSLFCTTSGFLFFLPPAFLLSWFLVGRSFCIFFSYFPAYDKLLPSGIYVSCLQITSFASGLPSYFRFRATCSLFGPVLYIRFTPERLVPVPTAYTRYRYRTRCQLSAPSVSNFRNTSVSIHSCSGFLFFCFNCFSSHFDLLLFLLLIPGTLVHYRIYFKGEWRGELPVPYFFRCHTSGLTYFRFHLLPV
jgi:hypothetical protein